jgi:SAM-dependent methyltransferase
VRLVNAVTPLSGARVLDLACGPGRHVGPLVAQGARVVGFDLSAPLLARARQHFGRDLRLVRGDMRRLPFRRNGFDLVLNLFTSFGYFADDAQHFCVLEDIRQVLRPGGHFILDYLNAAHVRTHLVPHEERVMGTQRVRITRRLTDDGRYVVKEMQPAGESRSFLERVRLFTPHDLRDMLARSGLDLQEQYGDYEGSPWHADAPRTILVARAL